MSDERPERSNDVTGKLFLGGVSWQTTEDGLKFYFEKFGKLKDCAVMKDKFTGQPRGFGFVQFEDASAVDKVLAEEHTIDGRVLDIKKAISREHAPRAISEKIDVKKIFVGGLEQAVTEGDFKDYFGKFGDITDAVVMMDRNTNRSRGFGFVTYADAESVNRVMNETHTLRDKVVEIKRAEPRDSSSLAPSRGVFFSTKCTIPFFKQYLIMQKYSS
uniref:RRM domain-containing protein n=1 Tax=Heterosigma akashiwo TaxID=2829 RepID=A0A7S3UWI8_HETAK